MIGTMGCLEKDEGCLDPNALNLDVTADENANCRYPDLRFNISHRWIDGDTSIFRLNEARLLPSGDTIVFSAFQFYVNAIELGDKPSLRVFDSVQLQNGDFIKDDLTLIVPGTFQFVTGQVNEFGNYDGLKFDIGYSSEWNNVDTNYVEGIESNHPWLNQSMRADNNDRFACKLSYTIYQQDSVTREIRIGNEGGSQVLKSQPFQFPQANHAEIGLFIDYGALLSGLDLRNDSPETIKESIFDNINDAIDIVQ